MMIQLLWTLMIFTLLSCNIQKEKDCKQLTSGSWTTRHIYLDREKINVSRDLDSAYLGNLLHSKITYTFKVNGDLIDSTQSVIGNYKLTQECNSLITHRNQWNISDTFKIMELSNTKFVIESRGVIYQFYK